MLLIFSEFLLLIQFLSLALVNDHIIHIIIHYPLMIIILLIRIIFLLSHIHQLLLILYLIYIIHKLIIMKIRLFLPLFFKNCQSNNYFNFLFLILN